MPDNQTVDVIVLGAGAAGLQTAATAAYRGNSVIVIDHAKQAGKKILISGGGRCNFTNLHTHPDNFLSSNPHFCKSALKRYTQWDFLALVEKHGIQWHEKTLGQLFCNDSSKQIVELLLTECSQAGARVQLRTDVLQVEYSNNLFQVTTSTGQLRSNKLVVATGGLSMPKLSASPLGYQLAEQFGHSIKPVRAGLVPFTLHDSDKEKFAELSGLATDIQVHSVPASTTMSTSFDEAMLFTHRGLSGPAMLQISNYWLPGEPVQINLLPQQDMTELLMTWRQSHPKQQLTTALQTWLPKRLIKVLNAEFNWPTGNLADLSNEKIQTIAHQLQAWQVRPNGTEGYRTAEVTLGGVNVDEVSSKTMESNLQPGLFFVGEVLDVTGWLGGYNFQWAWSSGWVCGQSL